MVDVSLVIKGGVIAGEREPVNLLIEKGKIQAIGQEMWEHTEVLDATGLILFPGFIDAHTHFDMDTGTALTADDFESGTLAALHGGTTTIIDFATQNKGESLREALNQWHQKAAGVASCDYGFHMAITDWHPKVAKELLAMKEEGITSFKLYMAYDALRVSDGALYQVLKAVDHIGGLVGVHCENGDLVNEKIKELLEGGYTTPAAHPLSRPDTVEKEAIHRFLEIAYLAHTPAHVVHLSTADGLKVIQAAQSRGQKVYVETCPQYLVLDESYYNLTDFESAKYVLSPPLRRKECLDALWQGLADGTIHTVSTDHCSFRFHDQKILGKEDFSKIPCGIPGVEHRAQLIYTYGVETGKLTLKQMAEVLSTNTAKLFGMYPEKGTLQVGTD